MAGANIGPLAQIGLAQNHRAGLAQFLRHERILRAACEPTSASDPAVVCMRSAVSMLSLIRTGMPCSGPRAPLAFALLVEALGDGQGVGIEFDHAVDRRPAPVDRFDPIDIFLGQGASR